MFILTSIVGTCLASPLSPCPPSDPSSPPAPVVATGAVSGQPVVDLAICLDTSGSMEGLLDAARARLWDIVNDLALAKPTPRLRVALLTFGNNGHDKDAGWVKVDIDFTEDLDEVSRQLFALTTNGGEEYVGRVLDVAAKGIAWSANEGSPDGGAAARPLLQVVVVAGNESADQDQQVSFRDACRTLIGRGIVVNSIYCGNPADELAPVWREVATLSDGQFAAIDQSMGAIAVSTPFDEELAKLSSELNGTYLPYGSAGAESQSRQWLQDSNAASLNDATAAQRCVSKAGALYDNRRWDLVDACEAADFKLESIKVEELPEAMRTMTPAERAAYVAGYKARREALKKSVAELGARRQGFVEEKQKEAAAEGKSSFGAAMLEAIRSKGTAKGLSWDGC